MITDLERVITSSQRLAPPTRRLYRTAVRSFVAFAGPDPRGWTPPSAEAWMSSLRIRDRSRSAYRAGLAYASRRWAALHNGRDFAAALEAPRVVDDKRSRSPEPLSDSQLDSLLGTCRRDDDPVDLRDRALLAVAINTGFRRAELSAIDFDDIDRAHRSVVVIAKRGRRHRVVLSARCWARLDACRFSGAMDPAFSKPFPPGFLPSHDVG